MKQHKKLSGWGLFPVVEAEVSEAIDPKEISRYLLKNESIIARGNGKSYGDAALGPKVLSMLSLNRVIDFNPNDGVIECEAGVLLSDLLPLIIPAGWFFHVTPGIKHITVGGAIASDVHGKNHPAKGCFSKWLISFELMIADGSVLLCSKQENAALFWQTCGGMGWTGVILRAKFQLMHLHATSMKQWTVRCENLETIFRTFEVHHQTAYAAAWIDTTASGATFGRGAVHLAEHVETASTMIWSEKKVRNVPFFAPSWLLNPLSIRAHNALYFNKNRSAERIVELDDYFYPLDSMRNWNRLYGHRGLVQYQFCLPEENAFEGIRKLMEMVRKSPETPFLSVLKRHGERPEEAIHSFPVKGYSLALDFPRTRRIFDLVKKLDELVWNFGGKIYLTKDACSAPKMGRIDPEKFGDPKFHSALRARISRSGC